MAHVITGKCLGETYARCAAVCPVDAIHPGAYQDRSFMVIDPEACIDCHVCVAECPIGAIAGTVESAPEWARINASLAPAFKDNAPRPPRKD